MGSTNLKHSLERKYAGWAGELGDHYSPNELIAHDGMTLRERELIELLRSADHILTEIDPSWNRHQAEPFVPHAHKSPIKFGGVSVAAYEAIYAATSPLTSRQVTEIVITTLAVSDLSKAEKARLANSVDASLRNCHAKGLISHNNGFPKRWSAVTIPPSS